MNQAWMIHLSETTLLAMAGVGLVAIIMATIYDFRQINDRHKVKAIAQTLQPRRQPHISVLIYARNNAADLRECLQAISQSYYQNYDIVVVDNCSTDETRRVVRDFTHTHTRLLLYHYRKRKVTDELTALRQGYRKSEHGELVLVMTAAQRLTPRLLKDSAAWFVANPNLKALRFHNDSQDHIGIGPTLWQFWRLSQQVIWKDLSVVPGLRIESVRPGGLYEKAIFGDTTGERVPYHYATDLILETTRPQRDSTTLRFQTVTRAAIGVAAGFGLFFAIMFLTYSLFVAATIQSTSLLIGGWAIVSIWLLVTIWSDDAARVPAKISLSFCVPMMYFALYSFLIVTGASYLGRAGKWVWVTMRITRWSARPAEPLLSTKS